MFYSFELQISDSQVLSNLWNGFKFYMKQVSVSSHSEVCKVFSIGLKITQIVINTKNICDLWKQILYSETLTLSYDNEIPIIYTFIPLIKLIDIKQMNFNIRIVEPDIDNIKEIAIATDVLSYEAFGSHLSYPIEYYEKILLAPQTLCLLAKCDDIIVGYLAGTYVKINKCNLLHLNMLIRKPDYPGINLIQTFFKDFDPNSRSKIDYLSLCVLTENIHALEIYKNLGFIESEYIGSELSKKYGLI